MPLPKQLVYNDLSGEEVKHVLTERFIALLNDVPYLQKHITLPRVKMVLDIELICWANQEQGESHEISDSVEIRSEGFVLTSTVDASGRDNPPDKVREDHGLPVPTPTRGAVAIEDNVEGRRVTMPNGAVVDRTGKSDKSAQNATVVEQDFGPAKSRGQIAPVVTGNQHRSGPVTSPNFRNLGDK